MLPIYLRCAQQYNGHRKAIIVYKIVAGNIGTCVTIQDNQDSNINTNHIDTMSTHNLILSLVEIMLLPSLPEETFPNT